MPILLALFALSSAHADEGMWLPEQLGDMGPHLEALGAELSPGALADPHGAPLGATVFLGHCTGSFVSETGLVITNEHCAHAWLQYASEGRGNLVRDGFMAPDRAGEVWAGPAARLWITESIRDVTGEVQAAADVEDDRERWLAVQRARKELVATCEQGADYQCEVPTFDNGSTYRLIKRRVIKDVRLVYAPPLEVAQFGGDADNWMWPRHAADFAFVRAYVGPDGATAPHAEDNVPYEPPVHLQVSEEGVKPGDFVLIAGFPARTYRYLTAKEVKHAALVRYPEGLELYGELQYVLAYHSDRSRVAASLLESFEFSLANVMKSYEGMLDNFSQRKLTTVKLEREQQLHAWVDAKKKRRKTLGADLAELDQSVDEHLAGYSAYRLVRTTEWMPQLLGATRAAYRLAVEKEKPDVERLDGYQSKDEERLRDEALQLQRSLYLPAERDVLRVLLTRSLELPATQRIAPWDAWISAQGGVEEGLDLLFANPELRDPRKRLALFQMSRAQLEASEDPWVQLAVAMEQWQDDKRAEEEAHRGAMLRLRPVYIQALREHAGAPAYHDANSTLRVSIGQVAGYSPVEAITYGPQTTLGGMLAKADGPPFKLSADMSVAASESPEVPLCFATTLDNTGGSSGSPTLDAQGRLVGLVFDRNYEGMAADWAFDADMTRSIHVDTRVALWLLKRDGATVVLDELGVK